MNFRHFLVWALGACLPLSLYAGGGRKSKDHGSSNQPNGVLTLASGEDGEVVLPVMSDREFDGKLLKLMFEQGEGGRERGLVTGAVTLTMPWTRQFDNGIGKSFVLTVSGRIPAVDEIDQVSSVVSNFKVRYSAPGKAAVFTPAPIMGEPLAYFMAKVILGDQAALRLLKTKTDLVKQKAEMPTLTRDELRWLLTLSREPVDDTVIPRVIIASADKQQESLLQMMGYDMLWAEAELRQTVDAINQGLRSAAPELKAAQAKREREEAQLAIETERAREKAFGEWIDRKSLRLVRQAIAGAIAQLKPALDPYPLGELAYNPLSKLEEKPSVAVRARVNRWVAFHQSSEPVLGRLRTFPGYAPVNEEDALRKVAFHGLPHLVQLWELEVGGQSTLDNRYFGAGIEEGNARNYRVARAEVQLGDTVYDRQLTLTVDTTTGAVYHLYFSPVARAADVDEEAVELEDTELDDRSEDYVGEWEKVAGLKPAFEVDEQGVLAITSLNFPVKLVYKLYPSHQCR